MILEHLRELPLNNILEEDLIHPTTNKVIYILECYMSLILGLTLEDIEIAVRDQLDIMEYPVSSSPILYYHCYSRLIHDHRTYTRKQ
jgi:hypothetical protein